MRNTRKISIRAAETLADRAASMTAVDGNLEVPSQVVEEQLLHRRRQKQGAAGTVQNKMLKFGAPAVTRLRQTLDFSLAHT